MKSALGRVPARRFGGSRSVGAKGTSALLMFLKRFLSRNGAVMALRQEIANGVPRQGMTQFVVAVYRIVYGLGYGDGEPAVCCRPPRTAFICSAIFLT